MTDSREEEGRKLRSNFRSLSDYKARVEEDTRKGNLRDSSLDDNVGTCSTGCGNGRGISHFSCRGSFCRFSEGVNLNKKERRLGMNGIREHATSRKNQKRAALEEDPDWLPEQESFVEFPDANNGGDLVGKVLKIKHNENGKNLSGEHVGVGVSIPGMQSIPVSNNIKRLLFSAGWTVVSQQGLSDLLYLSPSGSVYGSLSKALEAFSLDASEFRKKEQGLYQLAHSGGICGYSNIHQHSRGSKLVFENTHKVKETVYQVDQIEAPAKPVMLWDQKKNKEFPPSTVKMVPSGGHSGAACCKVSEEAESSIKNGNFRSALNYSSAMTSKATCHDDVEIKQHGSSVGVLGSVVINKKIVPVSDTIDMNIREDEGFLKTSTHGEFITGDLLLLRSQNHNKTQKKTLPVPDEARCEQVSDVATVDEKMNKAKRNCDGCSEAVVKAKKNNANIFEDGELHGLRRSKRINGRHVPIDTELNLEFWDDDPYLYSCGSVNLFTNDACLGTQEPDYNIDRVAYPIPEKIRYREVNDVFPGIADGKQKNDEGTDKNGKSTDMHKGLMLQLENDGTFMNLSSQDMLPLEPETNNESESEAWSERRFREVRDILASCKAVRMAKPFTASTDCSSDRAQKMDSTGSLVVTNGKDKNGNVHQDSGALELRRSARIDGKHVPVCDELDIGMWDFDDFIDLSNFEDKVAKKDKEKSAKPNSKTVDIVFCLPARGFVDDIFGKKVRKRSSYSISEMPNIVIALPAPSFLKQAAVMRPDCQIQCLVEQTATTKFSSHITRNREQLDKSTLCIHGMVSNKCDGEEIPVAEQGSSSLMDNWTQALEQASAKKSDNQKPRKKEQLNSNDTLCLDEMVSVKCVGEEIPVSEQVSSLIMDNGTKALKESTTRKPDNQKLRYLEQLEQTSTGKSESQGLRDQKLDCNSLPCMHWKKKFAGVKTLVAEKVAPLLPHNGINFFLTEMQPPLSLSKRKRPSGGYSNGKRKKKRSGGCGLVVRRTGKGDCRRHICSKKKCSILSWLIDNSILTENEKVIYKIQNDKGNTMKGCITRGGIRCDCCRKVWSLLEFEAHAGNNVHQPWINTCLISGKSLMQCQTEAWEREKKKRKIGFHTVDYGDADPSDDTCGICADGGHLICCDGCLSTFHQECVMLKSLPEGSWYCPFCRCAFCLQTDRGQDKPDCNFSILSCKQCGCKYHRDCVLEKDMDGFLSFCGVKCMKVAAALSDILGVSNPMGEGFSWTLLKHLDEDDGTSLDQRLSFIMECNVKLALALSVLDECFVPLVDPRTGLDMIVQAVYNCGSNYNRLNCERFYTMILEKDEEIISVATLRLHGTRLAEMPFIGTRPVHRRKGMCRRLINSIEKMLSSLHVEKLVIPAIPELLDTWMTSFSFKHLEPSHREEIRNLDMMIFAETTLLQKSLCCTETHAASDKKQDVIAGDLQVVD